MDNEGFFLIVGLGNPGTAYAKTRHNAGFMILDAFAKKYSLSFRHASHLIGDLAEGIVHAKKVLLLRPVTYMNSSGDAVRRCMDYYKVPADHLMVMSDEIALSLGQLRLRPKGSAGGHNGLKSIQAHLKTEHYARLRIGVGAPNQESLSDYVLDRFSKEELEAFEKISERALDALLTWLNSGIAAAMQLVNAKDKLKKEGDSDDEREKTSL